MGGLFILIYNYFQKHKWQLFSLMVGCFIVLSYFAIQVNIDEDVTSFFPDGKDSKKTALVFKNLKIKDKVIVIFTQNDTTTNDPDLLIEMADEYVENLKNKIGATHIKSITSKIEEESINEVTSFIYNNLPIFLTNEDYERIDTLLTPKTMELRMRENYNKLVSPMGIALKEFVLKDPIGVGNTPLSGLQVFSEAANYRIYNSAIFSEDLNSMLVIIDPQNGAGATGKNEALITAIENEAQLLQIKYPTVSTDHFGGPSVSVYNARQIKNDSILTLSIALVIIVLFIFFAFKNRWAALLIILPVIFGGIFALAFISLINSSISAIAIGAGAAVFGIAMSYSIHVLSHANHAKSIQHVIGELASPLTIGSFTTVGAFLGLLFTSSKLLRDFGLFAALALIGTTLFCLLFLPHMIKLKHHAKEQKLVTWIEKITSFRFDKSKIVLSILGILLVASIFTYNRVSFDSDMMHLNYMPEHLKKSETKLNTLFKTAEKTVLIVATGKTIDSLSTTYYQSNKTLNKLQKQGKIEKFVSATQFIIPQEVQKERIAKWNSYWNIRKKEQAILLIEQAGVLNNFAKGSFEPFAELINKEYKPFTYNSKEFSQSPIFKDWYSETDSISMLFSKIVIKEEFKEEVYKEFNTLNEITIVDRAYFAKKMAVTINNDFYLILYISSLLIFIALLISYGRIELALLSFTPMAVSWFIILGLMSVFGIEFNIVNIILSTFIFGIGDDFSIFIMDGLLTKYESGKKILSSHKTAIFFSAFTTIVGMGVLVFAKHPALFSISLISIFGMITVVLVSFTVQPLLFKLLTKLRSKNGDFPYTLASFLNTFYAFNLFLFGCAVIQAFMSTLWILPLGRNRKKTLFHHSIYWFNRFFLKMMITVKTVRTNESNEQFKKPAIIVANHQSFIDILLLLSINPKFVMVTNGWVYKSPFFGPIVRYADFYNTSNGYELLVDSLKQKVNDGYSIIVFPEGTRSEDNKLNRFHKGAFFLAQELELDIVPIILYGTGMISSKKQPFYIKKGIIAANVLPRIAFNNELYGITYQEKTKTISKLFKKEFELICKKYNTPQNPYFYDALIKNFTYKGPVLEWYMRVKIKMEHNYELFHNLIPLKANITDIGCGYGPLPFMLSLLSDERTITGIDYDKEKIELARHSFLANNRVNFVHANALEHKLPSSDVFVLNDMLHYLNLESQEILLKKCVNSLNVGGMIIIRDGDKKETKKHKTTELTEKLSTKIFKFNRTEGELHFSSSDHIIKFAQKQLLSIEISKNDIYTSNTIYILKRL